MRFFRTPVAVVLSMLGVTAATFASQTSVPAGTQVQIQLVHPLSSGTAAVNESFSFQAATPVVVNNKVVIAKGALGSGRVVSVSKAQGKSAGKMTLAFTSIHAIDGTPVPLSEDSRLKGNSEKGKASTATIAATIALGPIGLFAHNFVKGKDITVTPSQAFPAWVRSTTAVHSP